MNIAVAHVPRNGQRSLTARGGFGEESDASEATLHSAEEAWHPHRPVEIRRTQVWKRGKDKVWQGGTDDPLRDILLKGVRRDIYAKLERRMYLP